MKRTSPDGMLTIRGEKKTERDERDNDKNCHVVERSHGSAKRGVAMFACSSFARVVLRNVRVHYVHLLNC